MHGHSFLEEKAFGRLYAEDDVVENRETFDQLKVLVHHTDVEIVGVVRRVDMDFLPILLDDSGGRLIQTKRILIRVDFPAPFSPSRAWISPF